MYKSKYRYHDDKGQYRTGDLTGAGTSDGESGSPWQGFDPGGIGRHWALPRTGNYAQYLNKILLPGYLDIESVHDRLDALDDAGMIHYSSRQGGMPALKRYLPPDAGQLPGDLWTDIDVVNSQAKERTGYPTQKPLALLERVIKASSNEGDIILDPFCGCATACVAADHLGRQWVGIDISPKAAELVNMRLQQTMGSLFHHGYVTTRTDIPQRTDIEAPIPYRQNKHVLYGQQEGLCNGCEGDFPFKLFEVDHVVPRSRGGTDPPPQPSTPLLKLQPHQRRPPPGIPHGPPSRAIPVKNLPLPFVLSEGRGVDIQLRPVGCPPLSRSRRTPMTSLN